MQDKQFINLLVDIDDVSLVDFNGMITQKSIVDLAKTIESALISYGEEESKVRNIFLIIIEIMQNTLNYSYNSVKTEDEKSQSNGSIKILHNKNESTYTINSENLVETSKQAIITDLIDKVNALDPDGLKKVYKERRKSKSNAHAYGAGLGFLDMARKSKNKIGFQFSKHDDDSIVFHLQVKI